MFQTDHKPLLIPKPNNDRLEKLMVSFRSKMLNPTMGFRNNAQIDYHCTEAQQFRPGRRMLSIENGI